MTGVFPRFTTLTLCLFLSWPLSASAQTPAPITNADIVKLIQAGLPESAIINKIQANPGAFDTSTDALIALKKAGATDGELAAITAAPPAPMPAPAPMSPTAIVAATPSAPVEVFGGQLLRTKFGDPYVQFPADKQNVFPDGRLTNTASLVLYEGEPAILIPSRVCEGYPGTDGNMLFMKDHAIFDWYISTPGDRPETPREASIEDNYLPKQERQRVILDPSFFPQRKLSKFPAALPLVYKKRDISEGMCWMPDQKLTGDASTYRFTIGIYDDYFGNAKTQALYTSGEFQLFVDDLQKDFTAVLADFEKAAGITDITTQLSKKAHYIAISEELSQRYKVLLTQRLAEEKAKQGSKSWLASLNQLNDAVSLGSGLKTMGSGLVNGSGSAMQAGLQTTTASANAYAATGTQAQYAANAQMQASLAQSNAAYAQNAAGSQYAAATPATATTTTGTATSTTGTTRPPAIGAQAPQPSTTATLTITLIGPGQVTSQPAGINCPGVCSFTWPVNYTQQLYLTVTPPAGYLDNNECTGTAPITPGKATTCLLGGVAGTRNITVCTYKAGTPNPCP